MYILKEDVAVINQHDGYKRYVLRRNEDGYTVLGYDPKVKFYWDVEYFDNREDAMQFLCNLVDKLNGEDNQNG